AGQTRRPLSTKIYCRYTRRLRDSKTTSHTKGPKTPTPYFSLPCPVCQGHISDALLECLPPGSGSRGADSSEGILLRSEKPGAALACPYCNTPIGFDPNRKLMRAPVGTPLLRYSRAELERKKVLDGAPASATLEQWGLLYRFDRPGTHQPLVNYLFAEQA